MINKTYCCVRCGREREDHDTNMVMKSAAVLAAIGAEEILPGYQMCLLTCCDTPRPAPYTKLVWDLSGTISPYAIGFGAGYVSPNPVAEIENQRESSSMATEVTLYFPYGFGGPVADISG